MLYDKLINKSINELTYELTDELVNEIRDYVIFKPKTKDELQNAVNLWCTNKNEALMKYGHISLWDTSLIKDMSYLFARKKYFNENINSWDVSSVNNMSYMFYGTKYFNQPL